MRRELSFEIMRVISVFFVIFNHTGHNGYLLFTQREIGSMQYWVYIFASIFCLFSVPLYFMISGALLLEREESIRKVLKRIVRFIIVLFFISVVYYLVDVITGRIAFSFLGFWKQIYTSQVSTHLWFLYAYIVFLLCIPFLRAIVRNLDEKYYIYLFFGWFIMVYYQL